ncbi:unnamed protein product [Caenorhabditis brenneri]
MAGPPEQNNRRRQPNRKRAPRDRSRNEIVVQQNNKKVKKNPNSNSVFYQKKKLRSMRYIGVLFLGLVLIATYATIDPGTIDGLESIFIGFLCAACTIEDNIRSKEKRRGKKYYSYFNLTLFFVYLLYLDRKTKPFKENKDMMIVIGVQTATQFFGGFVGATLLKENEFVGGILGSSAGLVGGLIIRDPICRGILF